MRPTLQNLNCAVLSRRQFLRLAGQTLGAASAFASLPFAQARPASSGARLRLATLSGAQLLDHPACTQRVRRLEHAVDTINALSPQPHGVFFLGGLTQLGEPKALRLGAAVLAKLRAPWHALPAAQDVACDGGSTWRKLFGQQRLAITNRGVRILACPTATTQVQSSAPASVCARYSYGHPLRPIPYLGEANQRWLARQLAAVKANTEVIVALPEPPQDMGDGLAYGMGDKDIFFSTLNQLPRATVLHGFTHQATAYRSGAITVWGVPATAWSQPQPTALTSYFDSHDLVFCGAGLVEIDRMGQASYSGLFAGQPAQMLASTHR